MKIKIISVSILDPAPSEEGSIVFWLLIRLPLSTRNVHVITSLFCIPASSVLQSQKLEIERLFLHFCSIRTNEYAPNPSTKQESYYVHVPEEFVRFEQNAYWSFAIGYLDEHQGRATKRSPLDYKEVLNDEDFSRFAQLRELRNTLAKAEGKPAYAIFTNEQLATLVTDRVTTQNAMTAIAGIGESRISHYADQFLPLLQRLNGETGG